MDVHDYLEWAESMPWIWGGGASGFDGHDCTLFPADWAMKQTGKDPGEGIRGTYDSEAGALAVLDRWGGTEKFIESMLIGCGWKKVIGARDGDIGVVIAPLAPFGISGSIPAIFAGGLWVIRTRHGQRASSFQCTGLFRP